MSLLFFVLAGAPAFGSAAEAPRPTQDSAPAVQLSASLLSPAAIKLEWRDAAPGAAGHILEFATEPDGWFSTVCFSTPTNTTFTHGDLAPGTPCYYRVRPFAGPISNVVEITTGQTLPDDAELGLDDTWADPKTTPDGAEAVKTSLRVASAKDAAAPANLRATLVHPTGVHFAWIDRASDEDGFMLEYKTDDMPDFRICALIDANVNSYGFAGLPPETKVSFRLRAYYYGQPSNLAHQVAGALPAASPASSETTPPPPRG